MVLLQFPDSHRYLHRLPAHTRSRRNSGLKTARLGLSSPKPLWGLSRKSGLGSGTVRPAAMRKLSNHTRCFPHSPCLLSRTESTPPHRAPSPMDGHALSSRSRTNTATINDHLETLEFCKIRMHACIHTYVYTCLRSHIYTQRRTELDRETDRHIYTHTHTHCRLERIAAFA